MFRKIVIGLLILFVLVGGATVFIYFQYLKPLAFENMAKGDPRLEKVVPVSAYVAEMSEIGLRTLDGLTGSDLSPGAKQAMTTRLDELSKPSEGLIIAVFSGIRRLVESLP